MEVNFSELINKNRATVALLDDNPSILLHRRDGDDLVLSTVGHAEQEQMLVSTATKFFVSLMRHDAMSRELMLDVLPDVFPWVNFLPANEVAEFAMELVETARAADSIDYPAAIPHLVAAWRHTAEIYADPELAARLAGPFDGDGGPVPPPPMPPEADR